MAKGTLAFLCALTLLIAASPASAQTFSVLGQPDLASTSFGTRCADPNARFGTAADQFGPSGIAVAPTGRLFVTDFTGDRVMSWPNAASLSACQPADVIFRNMGTDGPEAVAVGPDGTVYVAATLAHIVQVWLPKPGGELGYDYFRAIGMSNTPGTGANRFNFPRGLAVSDSQLFVADDFNNRIQIFNTPIATFGRSADDSIGGVPDGGFDGPKGVALAGGNLFVADFTKNRVLRYEGPFDNPATQYDASAIFTGLSNPVDLAVGGNGVLHVTDQGNRRVASYLCAGSSGDLTAPDTSFSDNIGPEPLGIAVGPSNRLFLADFQRFRVLIRDPAPGDPQCDPPGGDTTAPEVSITKAPEGKIGKPKAKFKFVADEAGAEFECKFDNAGFKSCTSPKKYKRLDDGKHKFQVRATDAAGNVSDPDKAKFKVKT